MEPFQSVALGSKLFSMLIAHEVRHCHQLRLLLVHLLLSIPGSKPQDNVKPLLSQFVRAYHQLYHAKKGTGLWIE